ncbi:MAG: 5-formyltetrahydrofolate cyclo-ligase [Hyphomicrobiales bacterium]|nr:5-formyltetrahydrofolate cyclo-ligase [Hyphomicrobiales bacterium]
MPHDKAFLRTTFRQQRDRLPATAREAASLAIANHARAWLKAQGTHCCALYWPSGSEVDTRPLFAHCTALGIQTAFPALDHAKHLHFHQVERAEQLVMHPEVPVHVPPADAPEIAPECIFLPLLAFDRTGARLGQGGGYYDRTLARYSPENRPFCIGIAFATQESAGLPTDGHDMKLDLIITEQGLIPVLDREGT